MTHSLGWPYYTSAFFLPPWKGGMVVVWLPNPGVLTPEDLCVECTGSLYPRNSER
jgi:hypothetical protein